MEIKDIKNLDLVNLISLALDATLKIQIGLKDALENSCTDDELIHKWIDSLAQVRDGVTGTMKILESMKKQKVHVLIHMHSGVIFNTAVYKDEAKAIVERDKWIIEQYGELVEKQEGDDFIDLQECQVIV